ncbi:MAG TPA: diacylglycerol kinase [Anaeromyxobacter sp.]|nr:diacylglycerol kinase [Anaeromyxobacter sp.]
MERGRHGLLRSIAFAWAGLAEGAVRDRNLRIHLALGVLVGALAARAPLEPVERALLLACVAAVIAAESLNSAVEAAVDLASAGWDERARVAKDSAAGAVLALAAGSVLVLAAIAGPRLAALLALGGALGPAAAGALLAAVATALLPAPRPPSRAVDLALTAVAVAGLALVARGAASQAGSVAAALCAAIAAGGAARRGRMP